MELCANNAIRIQWAVMHITGSEIDEHAHKAGTPQPRMAKNSQCGDDGIDIIHLHVISWV